MKLRRSLFPLLAVALALTACDGFDRHHHHGCDPAPTPPPARVDDKVLLLQVDYQTNTFEGGSELTFPTTTAPTFTVATDYQAPGDFGNLRLTYQEVNAPLFDGSIVWAGCGARHFPQALTPAAQFTYSPQPDSVMPGGGYENVFNPNQQPFDYAPVWRAVRGLDKVRTYVASNPTASARLFLYTPSVGMGNPAEWKWILLLKGGTVRP